jgi:hypothetical protein
VSAWPSDDTAASEVLGSVLTFGILALVLIGLTLGLGVVQADARDRAAAAQADGVAVTMAAAVSEVAAIVVAEREAVAVETLQVHRHVDIPDTLAGLSYTVRLVNGTVVVAAPGLTVARVAPGAAALHVPTSKDVLAVHGDAWVVFDRYAGESAPSLHLRSS